MELSIFENGIQHHNQVIHQVLLKNGLYVMHEKDYSYTVGMKSVGAPDLILFGQSHEVAEEMFQVIFQTVKLAMIDLDGATTIDHIFDPKPLLEEISDVEKRCHLFSARTYYGDWEFRALKVLMDFH